MKLKRLRGLENWVSKDKEKLSWIWEELQQKGYIPPTYYHTDTNKLRDEILTKLNELATTEPGQSFITATRAKWSREQYKNNPNNKGLTVTLKPSMITKLDYLSSDGRRRTTLEKLIEMGYETEKEMRKIRRQEIDETKKELEENWPKKQFIPPMKQLKLKSDYKKLSQAFDKQQKILDTALFKCCQYKVLTEAMNIDEQLVFDQEKPEIMDLYEKLKAYHAKELDVEDILNPNEL